MPFADKTVQARYQRDWVSARRQAWLTENGPCRKCGSLERLQVDHIEPSQKVTHRVFSWRKDRRDTELAKCQPLCYDCHLAKSASEHPHLANHHGTDTGYTRHACRCDLCREAHRIKRQRDKEHGY